MFFFIFDVAYISLIYAVSVKPSLFLSAIPTSTELMLYAQSAHANVHSLSVHIPLITSRDKKIKECFTPQSSPARKAWKPTQSKCITSDYRVHILFIIPLLLTNADISKLSIKQSRSPSHPNQQQRFDISAVTLSAASSTWFTLKFTLKFPSPGR